MTAPTTSHPTPEPDWIEAKLNGDPPVHGTCPWCQAHLPPTMGCLNLCDMPTGLARQFNAGLADVIAQARQQERVMEALGGCTCPPPRLFGYATTRDAHQASCPMHPSTPAPPRWLP